MNKNPASSRLLYRLTVISFVVSAFLHAIALFAALGIMQPGLDIEKSVLERAIYVAENSTLWRLGWHLWQLVALANLAAAVLLMLYFNNVRRQTASIGRLPFALSILALLFTVAAIIPEQWGEYALVTSFVEQARQAVCLGNASEYVRWEARWIVMTTTCGAFGYTLMQLCWTAALVAYHGHVRHLKVFLILSAIDLVAFTLSVLACHHAAAPVLAGGIEYLDFHLVVLFNGIGFPVLFVWMLAFTAALGDRHHEFFRESSQQLQHLEFPTNSSLRWTSGLLNSKGIRDIMRLVGKLARTPVLTSDIRNVLYLNWLVPAERVSKLLPDGFQVDSRDSMAVVSILTYQHGGFGPRFLGKLRRWLPSPLQSNWRVYLDATKQGAGAVYFLKTCFNSSVHVIGSRLMSDGLPSHKSG